MRIVICLLGVAAIAVMVLGIQELYSRWRTRRALRRRGII